MRENRDVSRHILPTAATMVGVCVTVISIVRVIEVHAAVSTMIDDLMAVDGLFFLGSALLSYASLRTSRDTTTLERIADGLFLLGLTITVVASFMLAWEMGQVAR